MGITNSNKAISAETIECGGSFQITLSLTAEPDILTNPTDIVLILDRSGSMAGSPLANLKSGARRFVEILDESTDGSGDGEIGNGSRIAIVSFSDTGTQDTQLITSVADLNAAIDGLTAGGFTNHADAFTKALDLFDPASTNAKIMVMFTDGNTTTGDPPNPVASAAKEQGVIIYAIGLTGRNGIDVSALNDWSSDPDSAYVAITPDDSELEDLFEDLAENITKAGATEILIRENLSSCFRITSLNPPTTGTATLVNANTLEWSINALGVTASEGASLVFSVEHNGECSGTVEVNESIDYTDAEGNAVTFPEPTIEVNCDITVVPEPCPTPVELTVDACSDSIEFDAGLLALESGGRILQLDVTLRNVCPNRRIALAAIVTEVDSEGLELTRGVKTVVIPAHTQEGCRDVTVRCIKFVLPDIVEEKTPTVPCADRTYRARFIAHYIDSDFICCADEDSV